MRSKGIGPQNLGISNSMITPPAKHLVKRSGKPVGASHKASHDKGTAHQSIGQKIGGAFNALKATGEKIGVAAKQIGTDISNTVNPPVITKETNKPVEGEAPIKAPESKEDKGGKGPAQFRKKYK